MKNLLYVFLASLGFFIAACTNHAEVENKLTKRKWKQIATVINDQQVAGADYEGNLTYIFMPEGKCEIVFPKGAVPTTYEIIGGEIIQIQTPSNSETFTIKKLTDTELEVFDKNNTLLVFKAL